MNFISLACVNFFFRIRPFRQASPSKIKWTVLNGCKLLVDPTTVKTDYDSIEKLYRALLVRSLKTVSQRINA